MSKRRKSPYVRKTFEEKVHKHDWKHDIKVDQNYICPVCGLKGSESSLSIHHTTPVCKHGKSNKENCVAWHTVPCHRDYHKRYGTRRSDKFGNPVE